MANKLFLVSATLALFFLLSNASIYRTIVEFDDDAATNPMGPQGPIQECRKEFQQEKHLIACQAWLRKQAMQQGGGGGQPLDGDFDFENPMGPQQRPPLLQQCCNELHQEEEICVCPTLRRAAQAVRSKGKLQAPQQVSSVFQTAKHLPRVCGVQRVSVCPFDQAPPLFPPYY